MKISEKFVLTITLLTVIITALIAYIFLETIKTLTQEKAEAQLDRVILTKEYMIDEWLNQRTLDIETMSNKKSITQYRIISSQETVMKTLSENMEYFQEFYITNPNGKIIISTNKKFVGDDKSKTINHKTGRKRTIISPLRYDDTTKNMVLTISSPITNDDRFIGMLVGSITKDSLDDIVNESTGIGQPIRTYIFDKDMFKEKVQNLDEDQIRQDYLFLDSIFECLEGEKGHGTYTNEQDRLVISSYKGISDKGICLISELEEDKAYLTLSEL